MKIIDQNGIVKDVVPHSWIFGGYGAHGQNLIQRGLLPSGTENHLAHLLTLPITKTEGAILELLEQGVSQQDIISFAGVMAKAPNGTPSVHFLFGPPAQEGLKVALAMETFDSKNRLVKSLIALAQQRTISIIETNKVEHDNKMAIIQGLVNLWLVMIGKNKDEDIQSQLVRPWKTPIGTVVDMIHANPFAEIIIKEFFDSLSRHGYNVSQALASLIEKYLKDIDIEKFGTPNSDRVFEYTQKPGSNILVPREEIDTLRIGLNTRGHKFLAEEIRKIREGV